MEEKFFAHCLYIAELRRVKFGTRNFKIELLELRYMKRRKLVKFVVLYSFRLLNYINFCPFSLSFQCLSALWHFFSYRFFP